MVHMQYILLPWIVCEEAVYNGEGVVVGRILSH